MPHFSFEDHLFPSDKSAFSGLKRNRRIRQSCFRVVNIVKTRGHEIVIKKTLAKQALDNYQELQGNRAVEG